MGALLLLVFLFGAWKKVAVAQSFTAGAREGLETALHILPPLFCMLTAVSALRASGVLERAVAFLAPLLAGTNVPAEVLPLFLMRPLSGSASLAMVCASGETLFYVLAVYAGSSGVRKTGYLIPCALFSWLMGGIAAAWVWPLAA